MFVSHPNNLKWQNLDYETFPIPCTLTWEICPPEAVESMRVVEVSTICIKFQGVVVVDLTSNITPHVVALCRVDTHTF